MRGRRSIPPTEDRRRRARARKNTTIPSEESRGEGEELEEKRGGKFIITGFPGDVLLVKKREWVFLDISPLEEHQGK